MKTNLSFFYRNGPSLAIVVLMLIQFRMFNRPLARWIVVIICLIALMAWWYFSIGTVQSQTRVTEPVVCRDKAPRR